MMSDSLGWWRPAESEDCVCSQLQVSCLGLEGNLQGNPSRFALTSRGPEGGIQRYVLQASDPAVSQAWIKQVAQILESQRDFLNGEAPIIPLQ